MKVVEWTGVTVVAMILAALAAFGLSGCGGDGLGFGGGKEVNYNASDEAQIYILDGGSKIDQSNHTMVPPSNEE